MASAGSWVDVDSADATPPSTPGGSAGRRRSLSERRSEAKVKQIEALKLAALQPPPSLAVLVNQGAPYVLKACEVLGAVAPIYWRAGRAVYDLYHFLPVDLIQAVIGLILCFFGGAYCTTIAAVEAFNLAGWSTTRDALEEIYEDVVRIREAHEEDERTSSLKKNDGDPADAKSATSGAAASALTTMPPAEAAALAQRKVRVALLAVKDPEKLMIAVGGLYAGWLAVVGTLRIQFAKTVTLSMSIAEMVDHPATKFGTPLLVHTVPAEFHRWIPVAIRTLTKAVIVMFAWYMQVVLSAFQSAMRGGLMCARALLRLANKHGLVEDLHEDDTYLDECIGFALAFCGFVTQWGWGFALPFPLNVVMMPFTLVEWYIRWSITG